MRGLLRFRSGQTAMLMTFALPVMLGVMAFTTDLGVDYFNWSLLQKAADAAAIAGATYLPDNSYSASHSACGSYAAGPQEAACDWALNNGIASSEITSIDLVPSQGVNTYVSVNLQRKVPSLFARIYGTQNVTIKAIAKAGHETISKALCVLPVGLQYDTPHSYGESMTLKNFDGGGSAVAPGDWGALNYPGPDSGAQNFSNYLQYNYCQSLVSIGDWTSGNSKSGVMAGPTKSGLNARVSAAQSSYPTDSWQTHSLNDLSAAIIPLVDWTGCTGSCSVQIKGFAEVWLDGTTDNGKNIPVVFIQQVDPGSVASSGAPDGGAFKVTLVQ